MASASGFVFFLSESNSKETLKYNKGLEYVAKRNTHKKNTLYLNRCTVYISYLIQTK